MTPGQLGAFKLDYLGMCPTGTKDSEAAKQAYVYITEKLIVPVVGGDTCTCLTDSQRESCTYLVHFRTQALMVCIYEEMRDKSDMMY